MIIRINNRKEGIVQYLKTGYREDSEYTRDEKDKVVSVVGDLDLTDKTIKYINRNKKYKDAYQHITISFTWEDFNKFYDREYDAYDLDKIQEIVSEFMELYLAGYTPEEYTYYAELHYPKIKVENGKLRLPHIHIVLPLLNLISDTKLKPAFFNIRINDLIQTYIAKKHDLDLPIYHKQPENAPKIKPLSKEGLKRKELQELLKDIKTEQELLQFFKDNKLQYRKVQTKKNTYYKIINPAGKDINLRGRGLEHLEEIAKFGVVKNLPKKKLSIAEQHAQMSLQELQKELNEYLAKRVEEISKRRSKKATQELMKKQEPKENKENTISTYKDIKKQFQEILLEKIYNKYIPLKDKGFWIEKKEDRVKIINKKQKIYIEDRGNKIYAKDKNLKEQVKLMLDIAEAKNWNLKKIIVTGREEFKKEVFKQIKERLKARKLQQQQQISKPSSTLPFENRREPTPIPERPSNATEQAYKQRQEEKKLNKDYIKEIKENLDPNKVLEYAVKHYALDKSKYKVIGNKIKNLTNKQKPKNVIDFLQKEVGLSISEAFNAVDTLYKQQIKEKSNIEERLKMKLSYNTYTKMDYPVKGWKQKELKTKSELETLIKTYPYSPFVFKNGERSSNNTAELTSLILDFDNDNKDYIISMQKVAERLKNKGIKALLVETKSSGKEKRGIVAERFRVIIPITQEINISKNDKEEYRRAIENFARELNLLDYLDTGALTDIARMYRPSPSNAKSIVLNGNAVDFEKMMINAKQELEREEKERQEQLERERKERLAKLKDIENNIDAYTYQLGENEYNLNGLTYADIDKILSIPFEKLISNFEGIKKEYKEGSYSMIKTPNAKYSILKNGEVIHDFINNKTYNKISYLKEKLNVKDLISLARALQNITGKSYIKINENLVKNAIQKATEQATTLQEFNEIVKNECNVKFCRVDLKSNVIKIADIEVNVDTKAILNKINQNKKEFEEKQAEEQAYKPTRGIGR